MEAKSGEALCTQLRLEEGAMGLGNGGTVLVYGVARYLTPPQCGPVVAFGLPVPTESFQMKRNGPPYMWIRNRIKTKRGGKYVHGTLCSPTSSRQPAH